MDETPYCAAFVNWCLGKSAYKGNNSAVALKFKEWGRSTKDNKPAFGAIAVVRIISKKTGKTSYHVTFVAGVKGDRVATLGGNQGDAHEVSHSYVPANWVIAYRYPADYPHHEEDYVLHDVKSDHAKMSAESTH